MKIKKRNQPQQAALPPPERRALKVRIKVVAEDLRKVGIFGVTAGAAAFFLEAGSPMSVAPVILIGLVIWVIGIIMTGGE